jgi:hypothetical protein
LEKDDLLKFLELETSSHILDSRFAFDSKKFFLKGINGVGEIKP